MILVALASSEVVNAHTPALSIKVYIEFVAQLWAYGNRRIDKKWPQPMTGASLHSGAIGFGSIRFVKSPPPK
jgi:hypothetical protein